jgi:hypothetical protein
MARVAKLQAELKPVYVRPQLDRRQRAAASAYRKAAYSGDRHRPEPGDFDPLWLRLGLRACLIENRAGWVVSNPLYDQDLRRQPKNDPSLPGPGWLREVYRWSTRQLVTLPGVLAEIEARLQEKRELEQPHQQKDAEAFQPADDPRQAVIGVEQPAQGSLF